MNEVTITIKLKKADGEDYSIEELGSHMMDAAYDIKSYASLMKEEHLHQNSRVAQDWEKIQEHGTLFFGRNAHDPKNIARKYLEGTLKKASSNQKP